MQGGGQQQHKDALAVIKRWAGSAGSRAELAENSDVFSTVAHVAMGDFPAERGSAIELMTELCEDEKLHSSLMASGMC